jgi:hypothetical protein
MRVLVLSGCLAVLTLLVGCGTDRSLSDPTAERATPRGLIAGILQHVRADELKSVAVEADQRAGKRVSYPYPAPGYVDVDLKDGTSIGVSVTAYTGDRTAPLFRCTATDGYQRLECQDDPPLFIGSQNVREVDGGKFPNFEGRTRNPDRGEVLVQVVTDRSAGDIVPIIRAILNDENIGLFTTKGLNARGANLHHVEKLTITATIKPVN